MMLPAQPAQPPVQPAPVQTAPLAKKQKSKFKHGLLYSVWIDALWIWLQTFFTKSARLVLIITIMYMIAESMPSLSLKSQHPRIHLFMFIAQIVALDFGGMGLFAIGIKEEKEGRIDNANKAKKLSNSLTWLLIVSLVWAAISTAFSTIAVGVLSAIEVLFLCVRAYYIVQFLRTMDEFSHNEISHNEDSKDEEIENNFNLVIESLNKRIEEIASASAKTEDLIRIENALSEIAISISDLRHQTVSASEFMTTIQDIELKLKDEVVYVVSELKNETKLEVSQLVEEIVKTNKRSYSNKNSYNELVVDSENTGPLPQVLPPAVNNLIESVSGANKKKKLAAAFILDMRAKNQNLKITEISSLLNISVGTVHPVSKMTNEELNAILHDIES